MKFKKTLSLVLIAVLGISILSGCTDKKVSDTPETKMKETLTYGVTSEPSGVFNPTMSDTTYDDMVNNVVYSSLLTLDPTHALKEDLAASYTVSADNMKIQFTMKDNLKWHDGQVLTADDVVFTFKAIAAKDYEGPQYGIVENLAGVKEYHEGKSADFDGVKKIDDKTVEFTFAEPYAPGLTKIGGMGILPKHVWESIPLKEWKTSELLKKPVGSGPYMLNEFVAGKDLTLVGFEGYYNGNPKTKNLVFKLVNGDTLRAELEKGTVDIAEVTSLKKRDIAELEKMNMVSKSFPNRLFQYMGFNLRNDLFKDQKVRQAFMYAINRQGMVDSLIEGNGMMMNTAMIPSGWAYPEASKLNQYPMDVEKAKTLLKEAGWEDRNGDGIVEDSKGKAFKVVLKYPSGNKTREMLAPIIKENMKAVGVDVELSMMEFKTLMDEVVGNHDFDLYLMGNNLDADPDPKPYWHSTAASDKAGDYGWNISGFKNAEADQLIEAGLKTFDSAERKGIYEKFAVLMNTELPWVYLFDQNVTVAFGKNVKNYDVNTYSDFFGVENWYVEE